MDELNTKSKQSKRTPFPKGNIEHKHLYQTHLSLPIVDNYESIVWLHCRRSLWSMV